VDEPPVQPGDMLAGKYRVERVLGRGAMGVVVAASQVALDRTVALKFMTPGAQHLQQYVGRFHREALAAAKIQSQHAAKVLDFGTLESGAPYIVMEYLDGRDLAATIRDKGPFDVDQAVTLILQVCEALGEAHTLGIVHRDIKPANLFLTKGPDGSPCLKLVDFGVAKMKSSDLSLTGSMAVLGSPLYMSPEALNGAKDLDGRTDIWALGVSLYEMLAGVPPFLADTIEALIGAICMQSPLALQEYRPDVPAGLSAVIEQALEKKRDRRFPTVAAFAAALAPYARGQPASYVERVAKVQSADVVPARQTERLLPIPAVGVEAPVATKVASSGAAPVSAAVPAASTRGDTLPLSRTTSLRLVIALLLVVTFIPAGLYLGLRWRSTLSIATTGPPPAPTIPSPVIQVPEPPSPPTSAAPPSSSTTPVATLPPTVLNPKDPLPPAPPRPPVPVTSRPAPSKGSLYDR
jgi:eukaryotic-like serine/threonine-protein kinase